MTSIYPTKKKQKKIKVGDEVETSGGCRGIVTNTDTHYHIFFPENGKTWKIRKSDKKLLTKISDDKRTYELDIKKRRETLWTS